MKYIVRIKKEDESKLLMLCSKWWKSSLIEGLYCIETEVSLKNIQLMPFILTVEENRMGTF